MEDGSNGGNGRGEKLMSSVTAVAVGLSTVSLTLLFLLLIILITMNRIYLPCLYAFILLLLWKSYR